MNQNNNKRISNQFGAFCTRVLKNEVRKIYKEYAMQRKREVSLVELMVLFYHKKTVSSTLSTGPLWERL